jgi:hypothetical protein
MHLRGLKRSGRRAKKESEELSEQTHFTFELLSDILQL